MRFFFQGISSISLFFGNEKESETVFPSFFRFRIFVTSFFLKERPQKARTVREFRTFSSVG